MIYIERAYNSYMLLYPIFFFPITCLEIHFFMGEEQLDTKFHDLQLFIMLILKKMKIFYGGAQLGYILN